MTSICTQISSPLTFVIIWGLSLCTAMSTTPTTSTDSTDGTEINRLEDLFRTETTEGLNPKPMLPPLVRKELLAYHNEIRRQEGSANMVELKWDENLAKATQARIRHCYYHSHRFLINQNFGFVTMTAMPTNLTEILKVWYNQKEYFDVTNGICTLECDDYLTMVRAEVIQVGCAAMFCDHLKGFGEDVEDAFLLACQYYSPTFNELSLTPNTKGKACSQCPNNFPTCRRDLCSGPKSSYPPWDLNLQALFILESTGSLVQSSVTLTFLMTVASTRTTILQCL